MRPNRCLTPENHRQDADRRLGVRHLLRACRSRESSGCTAERWHSRLIRCCRLRTWREERLAEVVAPSVDRDHDPEVAQPGRAGDCPSSRMPVRFRPSGSRTREGPPQGGPSGNSTQKATVLTQRTSQASGTLIWSAACQPGRGDSSRCLRGVVRRGERIGCRRRVCRDSYARVGAA
jgi:hypothetical protein